MSRSLLHRLVVCDLALKVRREHKKPLVPRRKVWKLKDENVKQAFEAHVEESLSNMEVGSTIEEKWSSLKACLLSATDSTCGWTKGPNSGRKLGGGMTRLILPLRNGKGSIRPGNVEVVRNLTLLLNAR